MSWTLSFHPAALHGFYDLHPWTAARLDAALLAFAEQGAVRCNASPLKILGAS